MKSASLAFIVVMEGKMLTLSSAYISQRIYMLHTTILPNDDDDIAIQ